MDNDNRQLLFFPQQPGMRHPAQAAFASFCAVRDAFSKDPIIDCPTPDRLRALAMMMPDPWHQTREWRTIRNRSEIWHHMSGVGMHLHHLNYRRARGRERYGDLVFVTPAQHRFIHGVAA